MTGGRTTGPALDGRTVLITGGGSGIGEACTRRFAGLGAEVTVADVDEEAVERVASDTGGTAWHVDLSEPRALDPSASMRADELRAASCARRPAHIRPAGPTDVTRCAVAHRTRSRLLLLGGSVLREAAASEQRRLGLKLFRVHPGSLLLLLMR